MKRTEALQVGIALVLVLGVTVACKRRKKEDTPIVSTPAATTAADDDDDDTPPVATGTATDTATGAATGTAIVPAKSVFKVGDKVSVMWKGSKYPASIIGVAGGDKYKIHYTDYGAEWDETVGLDRIVGAKTGAAAATATAKATTGGAVKTGGGTAADAPCPGPGITRRCNGVCVNLQTDDKNCGGCGTVCPTGKRCDGHLFCRDADGNL